MPFEIEMAQTAVGVLQNEEGKILIVRRRPGSKIDPGKWELPKGKVRKSKETPETAIIREFAEETGMKVEVKQLLLTEQLSILGLTIKMFVFEVSPIEKKFEIHLSHEHQDHAWISPKDLDKYDFGLAMRGIIQSAFEKLGFSADYHQEELALGKIPPSMIKTMTMLTGATQDGVLEHPSIGRDCFVGDFNEAIKNALSFYGIQGESCHFVVKADPITFPTPEPGKYAVIVNANDIVTTGAVPYGMTLTLLLPKGTTKDEAIKYQRQAHLAAKELNLMVIGGHSEVTEAATNPVISAAMIGFVPISKYINHSPNEGDVIFTLGHVGAEGTGILASELKTLGNEKLKQILGNERNIMKILDQAEIIGKKISIVKALLAINRSFTLKQAHDATEGGAFGAAWELHQRIGKGMILSQKAFPIDHSTLFLSKKLSFDPCRLISSGLAFFIVSSETGEKIERMKEIHGLPLARVGYVSEDVSGVLIEETEELLKEPQADDLIKALEKINEFRC